MQKEEYLIKNACYSVTKYYLCKRNNKRSLSGRKQRLEVVRSFPNRYQFSFKQIYFYNYLRVQKMLFKTLANALLKSN